ncbi:MAG: GntG family PLP-dependent aldolase [Nitriliruptorales bacterium]|nr:GntG family PLP-dependent aldolase [Nitriliruptorales bacterium]
MDVIDLRSDTVTRPTDGMRRAMAAAEVGDDVYREDPTVIRLQERAAELFGHEAGLFTPSGVMANQIALRLWGEPGREVVIEADAHPVNFEAGAGAVLHGVQFRTVTGAGGILTPEVVEAALRPQSFPFTGATAIFVEQSVNYHGGAVYPLEVMDGLRALAAQHDLALYMDGARSLNAATALGVEPTELGRRVDGMMFCVSKGLGAPAGSLLLGPAEAIEEARTWRRRMGGQMRQVGVLAAAGLYALDNHVTRLAEDHANARLIAETIAAVAPDAINPADVVTNIVTLDTGERDAGTIVALLRDEHVRMNAMGPRRIRLVTHLDVSTSQCRAAAELLATALAD